MEIKDSTRSALVRKGNELFNQKDIEGAYRCYLTASYYGGIEKVADYYNFEKKNIIKAMQLYKFIMKEDSNLGGNVRAKQKLDKLAESVAKVLRKWLKEDETFNKDNKNNDKLELDSKNAFLPNNYKKNSLEDILKAKEKIDSKNNDLQVNDKTVNSDFYSKNINIKKPVFEQIYTNKQNKK
ncbi:hypothetical protein PQQ32_01085 [Brachyspira hyodysenteriae]|uniref:hypothetical protein n=1 Tax=Brachyspira hyodysenteriae TaxID=159 RepID=UPI0022CD80B6|nr:hypothetical protein [Brachyspira hyodysenteriae]MCZ9890936.1 hypothetical protein [Brachyspira hyodysenteriae]MCZ9988730.1 hypothetical protein [Brachyspira hyodysenteriae]MDA0000280.1 hypothetical protein [Brachyspira hyodysenteriae]MDA0005284.1 hypothetical protein [Brachyspira hyodysenteriae]MDA0028107.1 hypothetical protein [Brachyspira hyodysenteriae]